MRKPHPKYRIKEEDTLDSITSHFGVAFELWVVYHNNMCSLDDIIRENLPQSLKEIYLLPELWGGEKELNQVPTMDKGASSSISKRIMFGRDNTLNVKYCPKELTYKVSIDTTNNNEGSSIEYDVIVKWIKQEEGIHTIRVNKLVDSYRINKQDPDLVADELALKVGSILYPLDVLVSRKEGIIGVSNTREIKRRWEDVKKDILKYNEGYIVEKYLRLNEKSLRDEETILLSLRNDWFLHTYFNDIYQTYYANYKIENLVSVPLIANTGGIKYRVEQKINSELDEKGLFNISMIGVPSDGRSIIDIESKLDYNRYPSDSSLEGGYNAIYVLESQFNTIEKIHFKVTLDLEYPRKVDIHIIKI